ncbi:MAG: hypothetical protein ACI8QC_004219 [Planctomycetota bacterium]|jgi:hypothetical protein
MKALALAAGSALIGLLAVTADQRLAFEPAAGSSLSKSFETTLEFELDKLVITLDGEDDYEWLQDRLTAMASTELSANIHVVDTYTEVGGGRPLHLVRSFEALTYSMTSAGLLSWSQHDATLEGVDLTFTWDPKSEAYELTADIESLDLDDITHRGEDMDFRALLPAGPVEPGDDWELSGTGVVSVLWPGLDLTQAKAKFARTMAKSYAPMDMDELFDELIEQTELRLTCAKEKQVEGRLCQVILMRAALDYELNISDQLLALVPAGLLRDDVAAKLEFQAQLTGELLWDLAGGHFRDCRMDVDYVLTCSIDGSLSLQSEDQALRMDLEASGVLRRHAQAE